MADRTEQPPLGRAGRPAVRAEDLHAHTFAGGSLDRAGHLRADEAWVRGRREGPAAWFLVLCGDRSAPLVSRDGEATRLWWARRAEAGPAAEEGALSVYLGRDTEENDYFVAAAAERPAAAPAGVEPDENPRLLAGLLGEEEACVLAQARSMLSFHRGHKFCGRCGAATAAADAGWSRACGPCARSVYPRTDPVVIALVEHPTDPDRALMGRKKVWPAGVFSCLAGFLEAGESLEEAVRREVLEESGVRVGAVRYLSSQPWPFAGNQLMLGALAKAETEALGGLDDELECVRWFTRDELRGMLERSNVDWKALGRDGGAEPPLRTAPPLAIAHKLARAWLGGAGASG